jgi:hypothetical protein
VAKTIEKGIQDAVIKYARGHGIECIRMFFGPGIQTGWPDVLFLIPGGRPLFIEFKAPGKKPTLKQKRKIWLLKKSGYDVGACDNAVLGKNMVDVAFNRSAVRL